LIVGHHEDTMSEIVTRPAHELAVALRRREVSSRELLDCYLERVERLNPLLNAVVTLDPDGAQRAADGPMLRCFPR
jgi:amidase